MDKLTLDLDFILLNKIQKARKDLRMPFDSLVALAIENLLDAEGYNNPDGEQPSSIRQKNVSYCVHKVITT